MKNSISAGYMDKEYICEVYSESPSPDRSYHEYFVATNLKPNDKCLPFQVLICESTRFDKVLDKTVERVSLDYYTSVQQLCEDLLKSLRTHAICGKHITFGNSTLCKVLKTTCQNDNNLDLARAIYD